MRECFKMARQTIIQSRYFRIILELLLFIQKGHIIKVVKIYASIIYFSIYYKGNLKKILY